MPDPKIGAGTRPVSSIPTDAPQPGLSGPELKGLPPDRAAKRFLDLNPTVREGVRAYLLAHATELGLSDKHQALLSSQSTDGNNALDRLVGASLFGNKILNGEAAFPPAHPSERAAVLIGEACLARVAKGREKKSLHSEPAGQVFAAPTARGTDEALPGLPKPSELALAPKLTSATECDQAIEQAKAQLAKINEAAGAAPTPVHEAYKKALTQRLLRLEQQRTQFTFGQPANTDATKEALASAVAGAKRVAGSKLQALFARLEGPNSDLAHGLFSSFGIAYNDNRSKQPIYERLGWTREQFAVDLERFAATGEMSESLAATFAAAKQPPSNINDLKAVAAWHDAHSVTRLLGAIHHQRLTDQLKTASPEAQERIKAQLAVADKELASVGRAANAFLKRYQSGVEEQAKSARSKATELRATAEGETNPAKREKLLTEADQLASRSALQVTALTSDAEAAAKNAERAGHGQAADKLRIHSGRLLGDMGELELRDTSGRPADEVALAAKDYAIGARDALARVKDKTGVDYHMAAGVADRLSASADDQRLRGRGFGQQDYSSEEKAELERIKADPDPLKRRDKLQAFSARMAEQRFTKLGTLTDADKAIVRDAMLSRATANVSAYDHFAAAVDAAEQKPTATMSAEERTALGQAVVARNAHVVIALTDAVTSDAISAQKREDAEAFADQAAPYKDVARLERELSEAKKRAHKAHSTWVYDSKADKREQETADADVAIANEKLALARKGSTLTQADLDAADARIAEHEWKKARVAVRGARLGTQHEGTSLDEATAGSVGYNKEQRDAVLAAESDLKKRKTALDAARVKLTSAGRVETRGAKIEADIQPDHSSPAVDPHKRSAADWAQQATNDAAHAAKLARDSHLPDRTRVELGLSASDTAGAAVGAELTLAQRKRASALRHEAGAKAARAEGDGAEKQRKVQEASVAVDHTLGKALGYAPVLPLQLAALASDDVRQAKDAAANAAVAWVFDTKIAEQHIADGRADEARADERWLRHTRVGSREHNESIRLGHLAANAAMVGKQGLDAAAEVIGKLPGHASHDDLRARFSGTAGRQAVTSAQTGRVKDASSALSSGRAAVSLITDPDKRAVSHQNLRGSAWRAEAAADEARRSGVRRTDDQGVTHIHEPGVAEGEAAKLAATASELDASAKLDSDQVKHPSEHLAAATRGADEASRSYKERAALISELGRRWLAALKAGHGDTEQELAAQRARTQKQMRDQMNWLVTGMLRIEEFGVGLLAGTSVDAVDVIHGDAVRDNEAHYNDVYTQSVVGLLQTFKHFESVRKDKGEAAAYEFMATALAGVALAPQDSTLANQYRLPQGTPTASLAGLTALAQQDMGAGERLIGSYDEALTRSQAPITLASGEKLAHFFDDHQQWMSEHQKAVAFIQEGLTMAATSVATMGLSGVGGTSLSASRWGEAAFALTRSSAIGRHLVVATEEGLVLTKLGGQMMRAINVSTAMTHMVVINGVQGLASDLVADWKGDGFSVKLTQGLLGLINIGAAQHIYRPTTKGTILRQIASGLAPGAVDFLIRQAIQHKSERDPVAAHALERMWSLAVFPAFNAFHGERQKVAQSKEAAAQIATQLLPGEPHSAARKVLATFLHDALQVGNEAHSTSSEHALKLSTLGHEVRKFNEAAKAKGEPEIPSRLLDEVIGGERLSFAMQKEQAKLGSPPKAAEVVAFEAAVRARIAADGPSPTEEAWQRQLSPLWAASLSQAKHPLTPEQAALLHKLLDLIPNEQRRSTSKDNLLLQYAALLSGLGASGSLVELAGQHVAIESFVGSSDLSDTGRASLHAWLNADPKRFQTLLQDIKQLGLSAADEQALRQPLAIEAAIDALSTARAASTTTTTSSEARICAERERLKVFAAALEQAAVPQQKRAELLHIEHQRALVAEIAAAQTQTRKPLPLGTQLRLAQQLAVDPSAAEALQAKLLHDQVSLRALEHPLASRSELLHDVPAEQQTPALLEAVRQSLVGLRGHKTMAYVEGRAAAKAESGEERLGEFRRAAAAILGESDGAALRAAEEQFLAELVAEKLGKRTTIPNASDIQAALLGNMPAASVARIVRAVEAHYEKATGTPPPHRARDLNAVKDAASRVRPPDSATVAEWRGYLDQAGFSAEQSKQLDVLWHALHSPAFSTAFYGWLLQGARRQKGGEVDAHLFQNIIATVAQAAKPLVDQKDNAAPIATMRQANLPAFIALLEGGRPFIDRAFEFGEGLGHGDMPHLLQAGMIAFLEQLRSSHNESEVALFRSLGGDSATAPYQISELYRLLASRLGTDAEGKRLAGAEVWDELFDLGETPSMSSPVTITKQFADLLPWNQNDERLSTREATRFAREVRKHATIPEHEKPWRSAEGALFHYLGSVSFSGNTASHLFQAFRAQLGFPHESVPNSWTERRRQQVPLPNAPTANEQALIDRAARTMADPRDAAVLLESLRFQHMLNPDPTHRALSVEVATLAAELGGFAGSALAHELGSPRADVQKLRTLLTKAVAAKRFAQNESAAPPATLSRPVEAPAVETGVDTGSPKAEPGSAAREQRIQQATREVGKSIRAMVAAGFDRNNIAAAVRDQLLRALADHPQGGLFALEAEPRLMRELEVEAALQTWPTADRELVEAALRGSQDAVQKAEWPKVRAAIVEHLAKHGRDSVEAEVLAWRLQADANALVSGEPTPQIVALRQSVREQGLDKTGAAGLERALKHFYDPTFVRSLTRSLHDGAVAFAQDKGWTRSGPDDSKSKDAKSKDSVATDPSTLGTDGYVNARALVGYMMQLARQEGLVAPHRGGRPGTIDGFFSEEQFFALVGGNPYFFDHGFGSQVHGALPHVAQLTALILLKRQIDTERATRQAEAKSTGKEWDGQPAELPLREMLKVLTARPSDSSPSVWGVMFDDGGELSLSNPLNMTALLRSLLPPGTDDHQQHLRASTQSVQLMRSVTGKTAVGKQPELTASRDISALLLGERGPAFIMAQATLLQEQGASAEQVDQHLSKQIALLRQEPGTDDTIRGYITVQLARLRAKGAATAAQEALLQEHRSTLRSAGAADETIAAQVPPLDTVISYASKRARLLQQELVRKTTSLSADELALFARIQKHTGQGELALATISLLREKGSVATQEMVETILRARPAVAALALLRVAKEGDSDPSLLGQMARILQRSEREASTGTVEGRTPHASPQQRSLPAWPPQNLATFSDASQPTVYAAATRVETRRRELAQYPGTAAERQAWLRPKIEHEVLALVRQQLREAHPATPETIQHTVVEIAKALLGEADPLAVQIADSYVQWSAFYETPQGFAGPGPDLSRPPADAVSAAIQRLNTPNADKGATDSALVLQQAVYATRQANIASRGRVDAQKRTPEEIFAPDVVKGACGYCQAGVHFAVATLVPGAKVANFQGAHFASPGGRPAAQHAFSVVLMPDGRRFLIDPSVRQFFDPKVLGAKEGADGRNASVADRHMFDSLMRAGFVELSDETAETYGRVLLGRDGLTADSFIGKDGTPGHRTMALDYRERELMPDLAPHLGATPAATTQPAAAQPTVQRPTPAPLGPTPLGTVAQPTLAHLPDSAPARALAQHYQRLVGDLAHQIASGRAVMEAIIVAHLQRDAGRELAQLPNGGELLVTLAHALHQEANVLALINSGELPYPAVLTEAVAAMRTEFAQGDWAKIRARLLQELLARRVPPDEVTTLIDRLHAAGISSGIQPSEATRHELEETIAAQNLPTHEAAALRTAHAHFSDPKFARRLAHFVREGALRFAHQEGTHEGRTTDQHVGNDGLVNDSAMQAYFVHVLREAGILGATQSPTRIEGVITAEQFFAIVGHNPSFVDGAFTGLEHGHLPHLAQFVALAFLKQEAEAAGTTFDLKAAVQALIRPSITDASTDTLWTRVFDDGRASSLSNPIFVTQMLRGMIPPGQDQRLARAQDKQRATELVQRLTGTADEHQVEVVTTLLRMFDSPPTPTQAHALHTALEKAGASTKALAHEPLTKDAGAADHTALYRISDDNLGTPAELGEVEIHLRKELTTHLGDDMLALALIAAARDNPGAHILAVIDQLRSADPAVARVAAGHIATLLTLDAVNVGNLEGVMRFVRETPAPSPLVSLGNNASVVGDAPISTSVLLTMPGIPTAEMLRRRAFDLSLGNSKLSKTERDALYVLSGAAKSDAFLSRPDLTVHRGRDLAASTDALRAKIAAGQGTGLLVRGDLYNLGGVNGGLGSATAADRVIKRVNDTFIDAVRRALPPGADVAFFRDRGGAVQALLFFPNGGPADGPSRIRDALAQATQDVATWARQEVVTVREQKVVDGQVKTVERQIPLSELTNPKAREEKFRGIDLSIGIQELQPGRTGEQDYQAVGAHAKADFAARRAAPPKPDPDTAVTGDPHPTRTISQRFDPKADGELHPSNVEHPSFVDVEIAREGFVREAATKGLKREQAGALFDRYSKIRDPETGMYPSDELIPAFEHLVKNAAPNEERFYIEYDIGNLTGLTDFLGRDQADAVFKRVNRLVMDRLIAYAKAEGGEVAFFRKGGDEIGVLVRLPEKNKSKDSQTGRRADLGELMARARNDVYEWMLQTEIEAGTPPKWTPVRDIIHTKYPGNLAKRGTGIQYGVSFAIPKDAEANPTKPGVRNYFAVADQRVEQRKQRKEAEELAQYAHEGFGVPKDRMESCGKALLALRRSLGREHPTYRAERRRVLLEHGAQKRLVDKHVPLDSAQPIARRSKQAHVGREAAKPAAKRSADNAITELSSEQRRLIYGDKIPNVESALAALERLHVPGAADLKQALHQIVPQLAPHERHNWMLRLQVEIERIAYRGIANDGPRPTYSVETLTAALRALNKFESKTYDDLQHMLRALSPLQKEHWPLVSIKHRRQLSTEFSGVVTSMLTTLERPSSAQGHAMMAIVDRAASLMHVRLNRAPDKPPFAPHPDELKRLFAAVAKLPDSTAEQVATILRAAHGSAALLPLLDHLLPHLANPEARDRAMAAFAAVSLLGTADFHIASQQALALSKRIMQADPLPDAVGLQRAFDEEGVDGDVNKLLGASAHLTALHTAGRGEWASQLGGILSQSPSLAHALLPRLEEVDPGLLTNNHLAALRSLFPALDTGDQQRLLYLLSSITDPTERIVVARTYVDAFFAGHRHAELEQHARQMQEAFADPVGKYTILNTLQRTPSELRRVEDGTLGHALGDSFVPLQAQDGVSPTADEVSRYAFSAAFGFINDRMELVEHRLRTREVSVDELAAQICVELNERNAGLLPVLELMAPVHAALVARLTARAQVLVPGVTVLVPHGADAKASLEQLRHLAEKAQQAGLDFAKGDFDHTIVLLPREANDLSYVFPETRSGDEPSVVHGLAGRYRMVGAAPNPFTFASLRHERVPYGATPVHEFGHVLEMSGLMVGDVSLHEWVTKHLQTITVDQAPSDYGATHVSEYFAESLMEFMGYPAEPPRRPMQERDPKMYLVLDKLFGPAPKLPKQAERATQQKPAPGPASSLAVTTPPESSTPRPPAERPKSLNAEPVDVINFMLERPMTMGQREKVEDIALQAMSEPAEWVMSKGVDALLAKGIPEAEVGAIARSMLLVRRMREQDVFAFNDATLAKRKSELEAMLGKTKSLTESERQVIRELWAELNDPISAAKMLANLWTVATGHMDAEPKLGFRVRAAGEDPAPRRHLGTDPNQRFFQVSRGALLRALKSIAPEVISHGFTPILGFGDADAFDDFVIGSAKPPVEHAPTMVGGHGVDVHAIHFALIDHWLRERGAAPANVRDLMDVIRRGGGDVWNHLLDGNSGAVLSNPEGLTSWTIDMVPLATMQSAAERKVARRREELSAFLLEADPTLGAKLSADSEAVSLLDEALCAYLDPVFEATHAQVRDSVLIRPLSLQQALDLSAKAVSTLARLTSPPPNTARLNKFVEAYRGKLQGLLEHRRDLEAAAKQQTALRAAKLGLEPKQLGPLLVSINALMREQLAAGKPDAETRASFEAALRAKLNQAKLSRGGIDLEVATQQGELERHLVARANQAILAQLSSDPALQRGPGLLEMADYCRRLGSVPDGAAGATIIATAFAFGESHRAALDAYMELPAALREEGRYHLLMMLAAGDAASLRSLVSMNKAQRQQLFDAVDRLFPSGFGGLTARLAFARQTPPEALVSRAEQRALQRSVNEGLTLQRHLLELATHAVRSGTPHPILSHPGLAPQLRRMGYAEGLDPNYKPLDDALFGPPARTPQEQVAILDLAIRQYELHSRVQGPSLWATINAAGSPLVEGIQKFLALPVEAQTRALAPTPANPKLLANDALSVAGAKRFAAALPKLLTTPDIDEGFDFPTARHLDTFFGPGVTRAGLEAAFTPPFEGLKTNLSSLVTDKDMLSMDLVVRDHDGRVAATMSRTVQRHPDGSVQWHFDVLYVEPRFQRSGLAKALYAQTAMLAAESQRHAPRSWVTLTANVSVGRYSWAQYGFGFRGTPSEVEAARDRIREQMNGWIDHMAPRHGWPQAVVDAFKKQVAMAKEPKEFAAIDVRIADPKPRSFLVTIPSTELETGVTVEQASLGKAAMLGSRHGADFYGVTSWEGVLEGEDLRTLPERLYGGGK